MDLYTVDLYLILREFQPYNKIIVTDYNLKNVSCLEVVYDPSASALYFVYNANQPVIASKHAEPNSEHHKHL